MTRIDSVIMAEAAMIESGNFRLVLRRIAIVLFSTSSFNGTIVKNDSKSYIIDSRFLVLRTAERSSILVITLMYHSESAILRNFEIASIPSIESIKMLESSKYLPLIA